MYEPQHFANLQKNAAYGDPNSWLSGEDHSSPALLRTQSSLTNATATGASNNVDPELFNDLVQMLPLVQSLVDRQAKSSFTRRGSMIYTKMPSRESLYKKIIDPKAKSASQSVPAKKWRDNTKDQGRNSSNDQDGSSDSLFFSSRALSTDQDREELLALREQVKDLQNKLLEKDELLKSAEDSMTEMTSTHAKLAELKLQTAEKDSLIKSTQLQLSDVKIKLADKQAAVEKLQWEAMTSNKKVEKLQEDLHSMQGDFSSFMLIFEDLAKNSPTMSSEDYDVTPCGLNHLPHTDDWDEMDMQKIEEARLSYIAAVAVAKEKQDEDSIAAASNARLHLHNFVFKTCKSEQGNS